GRRGNRPRRRPSPTRRDGACGGGCRGGAAWSGGAAGEWGGGEAVPARSRPERLAGATKAGGVGCRLHPGSSPIRRALVAVVVDPRLAPRVQPATVLRIDVLAYRAGSPPLPTLPP